MDMDGETPISSPNCSPISSILNESFDMFLDSDNDVEKSSDVYNGSRGQFFPGGVNENSLRQVHFYFYSFQNFIFTVFFNF